MKKFEIIPCSDPVEKETSRNIELEELIDDGYFFLWEDVKKYQSASNKEFFEINSILAEKAIEGIISKYLGNLFKDYSENDPIPLSLQPYQIEVKSFGTDLFADYNFIVKWKNPFSDCYYSLSGSFPINYKRSNYEIVHPDDIYDKAMDISQNLEECREKYQESVKKVSEMNKKYGIENSSNLMLFQHLNLSM